MTSAAQLGMSTPQGGDSISLGDNAITQNANATAVMYDGIIGEIDAAAFVRAAVGSTVDFNTIIEWGGHPIRFGGNPNSPTGGPGTLIVGDAQNGTIDFVTQLFLGTGGGGIHFRSARNNVWEPWHDFNNSLDVAAPQNRLVDFNTLTATDVYPIQTGDNPNGPGYPGTTIVSRAENSTIEFITQLHIATDDKGLIYRSYRAGVWAPWRVIGEVDLGPDMHTIMESEFIRRRGGKIYTSGLPVACLRFDHHLDDFVPHILPILKELKLPWAQAINPGNLGTRDDNYTYAQLQNLCINGGGEVANHGNTHADAQTIAALKFEVLTGWDSLTAGLPAMPIEMFMPPGVGDGGYMGWAPIREIERWDSPGARMVLRRHAVTTAYMGNRYRPLGGNVVQGHSHRVMDGAEPYHWTQSLDIIKRTKTAITFMLHPSVLSDGQNTIAQIRAGLELVAAARDRGEILVLSPSATVIADIGTGPRRNLAKLPTIAAGATQDIDVFNPDCRGALHEVTWSGGGTVTVTDNTGTLNTALTGGRGIIFIPYFKESTVGVITLASTLAINSVKITAV